MNVLTAIAEILKREGVEFLIGFPVNPIIDAAAKIDIRPIIVRQERTGLHMADGFSRISSGRRVGVFVMQLGPGAENAFGGVAQAYADSVPILVLPLGHPRSRANIPPNFNAFLNYRHVTKWIEQAALGSVIPDALRRAFTQVRNGRPRPVLVEIPADILREKVPEPLDYTPTFATRTMPDPQAVAEVARVLAEAQRPVIFAGQGVHYAQAWQELRGLAELLSAPVVTSLQAKSAFPENHPLALGCGGSTMPETVHHFLHNSDVILGIGCSFTRTPFNVSMPTGKVIIHATLDTTDLNKGIRADHALIGDARLTLKALISQVKDLPGVAERGSDNKVAEEIKKIKSKWLTQWMPKLTSDEVPLSPYRVIWDLMHTVDRENTIITHDAGGPRNQLCPFWEAITPLSYIGWGKSTQLGYSLGLTMGAKLAEPDKLCIAFMGDAAFGMTGMDFETAVRERIPILVIVTNNFSMACEIPIMQVSTEKYGCTNLSGNYADLARALGGYGERVTQPEEIVPAVKRGIQKTQGGTPVLLEFITAKEFAVSTF